ncbi:MAG: methylenetetrahydrofolate reductase (NADPH) [Saprospiraceae bacterium]|jgi:methylenetetrahydrofolate reductase (NADPH)
MSLSNVLLLEPQIDEENKPVLSFEFYPAKTAKSERTLWRTMGQLESMRPAFYSMTFGALGSDRDISIKMLKAMQKDYAVPITAPLTATGHSKEKLVKLAATLHAKRIQGIVALRGDADTVKGRIESVPEMIRLLQSVADFDISVAAYPEVHPKALSPKADLFHLKSKLESGANRAITQYFFDADVFLRFRDKAVKAGIKQPIIPGILPVHDIEKVIAFSNRCGAQVPHSLTALFTGATKDREVQQRIGVEHATSFCSKLLSEGVDALHFYTLNLPKMSHRVAQNLGFAS